MVVKQEDKSGSPGGSAASIPVRNTTSGATGSGSRESYVDEKKKGFFRKKPKSKPNRKNKNKELSSSSTQSVLQGNDSSVVSMNSENDYRHRRHHRRKHSDESSSDVSQEGDKHDQSAQCFHSCLHHIKGFMLLLALLIYHFLGFLVIISLGLGLGILAAVLHDFFWATPLDPFWQLYVTLMTIVIVIEVYFRIGVETILYTWIDKLQKEFAVELFYIPRILYFFCYIASIFILYFSYYYTHHGAGSVKHHHSENGTEEALASPLSLNRTNGELHYTLMFTICLCLMEYLLSKENDWVVHRKITIESGKPDPLHRGGIGNFVLYLAIHIMLTGVYVLPLVGIVFLMRQIQATAGFVFFTGAFIAILVGVTALFIERRSPFPTKPHEPPSYPYENHLRIRVAIFQVFLLPCAAGRFFDGSKEETLSAQSNDFLFFTVEVCIGIIQAIKIFGNWFYIINAYLERRREESKASDSMEYYGYGPTLHPREPISTESVIIVSGIEKSNEMLDLEEPQPEEDETPAEVIAAPPASFLPQKSSHLPPEMEPESQKPSIHELSKTPTPVGSKIASPTPIASKVASPTPKASKVASPTPKASKVASPTPVASKAASPSPTPVASKVASPTPIASPVDSPTPVASTASPSGIATPSTVAPKSGATTPRSGSQSTVPPASTYSFPRRLSSSGPHYSNKYIS